MFNKKIIILFVLIPVLTAAGYLILIKNRKVGVLPEPEQPATPTASADITAHSEPDAHVEFEYPAAYTLQGSVASGYLSIMSPLDPDKPPKETTAGAKELKIEVVTENSVADDSSEKCFYDHSENPNVLGKSDVTVGGVKGVLFQWQGLGTGEFVCIIKNDKRYMINKYPIETSRQADYRHFISSWKFI